MLILPREIQIYLTRWQLKICKDETLQNITH